MTRVRYPVCYARQCTGNTGIHGIGADSGSSVQYGRGGSTPLRPTLRRKDLRQIGEVLFSCPDFHWEHFGNIVGFALGLCRWFFPQPAGRIRSMPGLQRRNNIYYINFRLFGRRFHRSLRTGNERTALACLARLDDNLRRVELGTLELQMTSTWLRSCSRTAARPGSLCSS